MTLGVHWSPQEFLRIHRNPVESSGFTWGTVKTSNLGQIALRPHQKRHSPLLLALITPEQNCSGCQSGHLFQTYSGMLTLQEELQQILWVQQQQTDVLLDEAQRNDLELHLGFSSASY